MPECPLQGPSNPCAGSIVSTPSHLPPAKEHNMFLDFGKRLLLGIVAAAIVVGMHAAMIASAAG